MTDKFKLTFNKPAVRQFLEGEDEGLRIRVEKGVVMFKTSPSATGEDATRLERRTRGGIEAVIEGDKASDILASLQNPAGPFFVLKRQSSGWVAAEPYDGADAPPKFEPHVRVWTPRNKPVKTVSTKSQSTRPTRQARQESRSPVASPLSTPDSPYLDTVRAAYARLAEVARPGRPTNEERQLRMEAREIVSSFEATAKELMALPSDGERLDMSGLISAHKLIGDFINKMAPGAERETVDAPEAATKAKAPAKASSDDEKAEAMSREAMAKMGLTDHDQPKPRRRTKSA